VRRGTYLDLDRKWKRGDRVELELDMRVRGWAGEKECRGRTSLYRGPVLLTWDRRLNQRDWIPALDRERLRGRLVEIPGRLPTMVAVEMSGADNARVRLCDFASAGQGGAPYVSWLRVRNARKTPFSRSNPLRSGR
jgi:hypothetical protein